MKKILSLFILSLFLVSCTGNTEKTPTDELPGTPVNQVPQINEDETNTEDFTDEEKRENQEEENNTDWEIEEKVWEENTEKEIEWVSDTEINTDDQALETEVNDLLDEFIDSLDSYDK